MNFNRLTLLACISALIHSGCDEMSESRSGGTGTIVLGDSSTIVTERDSAYLTNYVADLQLRTNRMVIPETEAESQALNLPAGDSAAGQAKSSVQGNAAQKSPETVVVADMSGKGLRIDFKELTVFFPGLDTRTYRKQDFSKLNDASFELIDGKLEGNQIQVKGGGQVEIAQRYMTAIVGRADYGVLELSSLNHTSGWVPVKSEKGIYRIQGLEPVGKLESENPSPNQLKVALNSALKPKKLNAATRKKWTDAANQAKSAHKDPFSVNLRSVMWRIRGKDANGKTFQKLIRIDLPVR